MNSSKTARDQKKFRPPRDEFLKPELLAPENSGMKKKLLFSLNSSILFITQSTPIFFTRFISCFKIHFSKFDIK